MNLLDVPNDILAEYFYWLEMVDMIPLSVTNKYLCKECKNHEHFVYFLKHLRKIGCGEYYSTIIKNNNLYFFGFNIMELDNTISSPKKINKHTKIYSVSCGADYAIVTTNIGTYSIGNYDIIQLNYNINNIIATYSGNNFILIYTKHHLYAMGCNNMGQLGLGYLCDSVTVPTVIHFFDNHKIKYISVGDSHSIVTTDKGTYVFGGNKHQQLGLNCDYHCITTPHKIYITHTNNNGVALMGDNNGDNNGVALVDDNNGNNNDNNDNNNVILTSCGGNHSFILTSDGLYGAGSNVHGELGLSEQGYYRTFTKLPNNIINDTILSVTCGFNFTFIMTPNKIITLGDNFYGQLSLGNFLPKSIRSVACGYNHSIIQIKQEYYAMGSNKYNQLGLGKYQSKKYKVPKLIRLPII